MMAILKNSDGCIKNDPTPNQLRDPFRCTPKPGIKTNNNATVQMIKKIFACPLNFVKDILLLIHITKNPINANTA